jgi:hypothetical protein
MNEFEIEIIFISSNTPKRMKAVATYTNQGHRCTITVNALLFFMMKHR